MLQSHEAFSLIPGDVIESDGLVSAQGHNEANACLVGVGRVDVNIAPLEVSHCTILLVET